MKAFNCSGDERVACSFNIQVNLYKEKDRPQPTDLEGTWRLQVQCALCIRLSAIKAFGVQVWDGAYPRIGKLKKKNYIGICPGPGRLCVFASFRSLLLSISLKSGPLCWQSFAFSSFPSHTCPEFRLVVFKTEWLCFYSLLDHSCQW